LTDGLQPQHDHQDRPDRAIGIEVLAEEGAVERQNLDGNEEGAPHSSAASQTWRQGRGEGGRNLNSSAKVSGTSIRELGTTSSHSPLIRAVTQLIPVSATKVSNNTTPAARTMLNASTFSLSHPQITTGKEPEINIGGRFHMARKLKRR
jgi:hypothetical protein